MKLDEATVPGTKPDASRPRYHPGLIRARLPAPRRTLRRFEHPALNGDSIDANQLLTLRAEPFAQQRFFVFGA